MIAKKLDGMPEYENLSSIEAAIKRHRQIRLRGQNSRVI